MPPRNRIDDVFEQLRRRSQAALIPYLTAGFPSPEWTVPLLEMLATHGADIIELGVPFSDPVADGPTIQAACKVALDKGTTLQLVLNMVRKFREKHATPIVLFGALNPFHHYGIGQFVAEAAAAGADGVLIPDVPIEETKWVRPALEAHNLHLIELIAPTTPFERKKQIVAQASGFLYYISVKGVTGARATVDFALDQPLGELRSLTTLPVVVGFGIATPQQAATVARLADGAVVGSALIDRIRSSSTLAEALQTVGPWFQSLKTAVASPRVS